MAYKTGIKEYILDTKCAHLGSLVYDGDVGLCTLIIVSDVCLTIQAPEAQWLRC